jgi:hypothetical protein
MPYLSAAALGEDPRGMALLREVLGCASASSESGRLSAERCCGAAIQFSPTFDPSQFIRREAVLPSSSPPESTTQTLQ